jgi:hypothetical protein
MCEPVSLLTTELEDVIRDRDFWWAGSTAKEVMCPIVTSKVKGTKGLRLVELRVDPGGTTSSCRLVSRSGSFLPVDRERVRERLGRHHDPALAVGEPGGRQLPRALHAPAERPDPQLSRCRVGTLS